jgi:hypothetical protein
VHVSTSAGFTPSTATLRGTLAEPGELPVNGLTAATNYYVKLRGRDAAGNYSAASAQAGPVQTGLTTSSDYGTATITSGAVAFNARAIGGITTTVGTTAPTSPVEGDIWLDTTGGSTVHKRYTSGAWAVQAWGSSSLSANCITATQIAASAVTAGAIAAGAVTAAKISADAIDGRTITGSTIQTAASGARVVLNTSGITGFDAVGSTKFSVSSSTGNASMTDGTISGGSITGASISSNSGSNRIVLTSGNALQFYNGGVLRNEMSTAFNSSISQWVTTFSGPIDIGSGGMYVAGSTVDMPGVYSNNTTGLDSVGITTAGRLRRLSSTQAIKYDIAEITNTLSQSVDAARQTQVVTVDPAGILDVAVVEFSVIDDEEPTERRVLGFIADDVADKLPIAATRDADGNPAGVLDVSLIAALTAVVQQQQATITDLISRVEALEAN